MPADKADVLAALGAFREDLERLVSSAPEDAWSRPAYVDGWNAKELLSHIASTSGVAGFLVMMARAPQPPSSGGDGFDQDAWNAEEVARRRDRSVPELMEEMRDHVQRDEAAVAAADAGLLAKHYRAPWGIEGRLADVIVGSLEGHLAIHLRDLARALA